MSNLEHYFENLLFYGQDVNGDWNKNTLSEAEQEAVRICADYVLYTIFLNRNDFLKFVNGDTNADLIRHMPDDGMVELFIHNDTFCCPKSKNDMDYCKKAMFVDGCRNCFLKWLKQEDDYFCAYGERRANE